MGPYVENRIVLVRRCTLRSKACGVPGVVNIASDIASTTSAARSRSLTSTIGATHIVADLAAPSAHAADRGGTGVCRDRRQVWLRSNDMRSPVPSGVAT